MNRETTYKELIDSFEELNISDKRKEIINKLKEELLMFQTLCMKNGINPNLLLHSEMNDYKESSNEAESLNSIYAYIVSIEELIGELLINN